LAWVFQPENVKPECVKLLAISAVVVFSDWFVIDPEPPLALKVTAKKFALHCA
jgi:hypothetical protein